MKQTHANPASFRDEDPAPPACRECGRVLDACTSLNGQSAPRAGSASVCGYCGALSVFEDDRLLREPTAAELETMRRQGSWPLIVRAQQFIRSRRGPSTHKP